MPAASPACRSTAFSTRSKPPPPFPPRRPPATGKPSRSPTSSPTSATPTTLYTRDALARITQLLDKVCSVHGANHPELRGIQTTFAALRQELTMHMMKEEMMLFPYIVRMEEAVLADEPVLPPPFGTVRNPVAMMMREHDGAGEDLREIRAASNGYTAPADGCITYQTLYRALAEFEADLHQHIHLENNILFPRALKMEQ